MKNQFTISALWLLSAVGTFALGWAVKPQQPTADSAASNQSRLTSLPGQPRGGERTPASRNQSDAADIRTAGEHVAHYLQAGEISAESMASAMEDMRKENDPIKKRAMFSQLLERLTPDNAKAAFLALREGGGDRRFGRGGPGGGGSDETRLLLNAWGRIDGAGAVAELQAMEDASRAEREARGDDQGQNRGRGGPGGFGGGGGFDIASVVSGWATTDATGAMDYVNGIEDERMKGMMTGNIVRGIMINGVDEAVAFISTLPAEDENRGRHMWSVAEEVLEDGAASAAKWVDNLGDNGLKEGAMRRIAESYARENLEEAVAWIGQHGDQDYARSAVTEVAERWAESDPRAVIEWAGNLPEDTQKGVFAEALDEWTERDEVAASEYLAQMDASPVRDSAVKGFATELSRKDPESAATWAATITEPELRNETLARVASDWMRSARAAAEAWLPTSGLSDEQQQQVTESRGRGFDPRGGRGGGRGR